MASGTFGGVSYLLVVRIGGGIIIIDVATCAGIWCIGIIAIVTSRTIIGKGGVSALDDIVVIVHIKVGGTPTGLCRVTSGTIIGKCEFRMVGVRCLIKVGGMTVYTGSRCTGISIGMTTSALDRNMGPGEWEVG